MTTKEKLEVAIRKMEAARKSANETKSDADYIALKQCEKEVEALCAQVDAGGMEAPRNGTTEKVVDDGKFIAPANVNVLREAISNHMLKVYGREVLSSKTDIELKQICLGLLEEARTQYLNGENPTASVLEYVQRMIDEVNETYKDNDQEKDDADGNRGSGDTPAESEGSVGGDNIPTPTPTDEDNTPAEPENKPAESLKEEKPTTTPKPKKEGGKKAKN